MPILKLLFEQVPTYKRLELHFKAQTANVYLATVTKQQAEKGRSMTVPQKKKKKNPPHCHMGQHHDTNLNFNGTVKKPHYKFTSSLFVSDLKKKKPLQELFKLVFGKTQQHFVKVTFLQI
jgi:hypothetical protein